MKSRFAQIRWRFQGWVLVQILALSISLGGMIWALSERSMPAVALVLFLLFAVQVAVLLGTVAAEHRKLERFLDALAFDDLSLKLTESDWDTRLASAANHVIDSVREARVESEAQASYLNALVRHVPVAILSLRPDGEVVLQNNAARHLFQVPRLSHIDDLSAYGAHLPAALRAVRPGDRRLLRAARDEQVLDLKVSATEIRLPGSGDVQTLLAIENIRGELDDREVTAWRDLIRVLTHEMMNSVTPIASLARTIDGLIDEVGGESDPELVEDMHAAVATIARRSDGLIQFVEGYRRLTGVPQPRLKALNAAEVLDEVRVLFADSEPGRGIPCEVDVEPATLRLHADPALLQQVLINLARNAGFALRDRAEPLLRLSARAAHGRVQIRVEDNGCGIGAEDLSQVFIPFFTTRSDGSGVGLTLARQIMSAHGGTIALRSTPDVGTQVTLTF